MLGIVWGHMLAPENDYGLASDQKLSLEKVGIGLNKIDVGLTFISRDIVNWAKKKASAEVRNWAKLRK